jgi:ankyrin repeat protein
LEYLRADQKTKNELLSIFAERGNKEAVELLLRHGADPNAKNSQEAFPLHVAIYGGCGVVEALLKAGADPNAVDYFGRTPLHLAAASGLMCAVELLLQYGAE